MDSRPVATAVNVNDSADCFSPLQCGLNIIIGQMPATFITLSRTMRVNRTEPVRFLSERGFLGTEDPGSVYLDSVSVPLMLDRCNPGDQEISFVGPESVDGGEMLVGKFFTTLAPELTD